MSPQIHGKGCLNVTTQLVARGKLTVAIQVHVTLHGNVTVALLLLSTRLVEHKLTVSVVVVFARQALAALDGSERSVLPLIVEV